MSADSNKGYGLEVKLDRNGFPKKDDDNKITPSIFHLVQEPNKPGKKGVEEYFIPPNLKELQKKYFIVDFDCKKNPTHVGSRSEMIQLENELGITGQ